MSKLKPRTVKKNSSSAVGALAGMEPTVRLCDGDEMFFINYH